MKKIIEYFSNKHILVNFLVIIILIGGVIFWNNTGKEDMPNINFDMVRINASYPGATAEEVDYYVTRLIEEALEGIDGIKTMQSSSGQGSCSFFIELDPDSANRKNVVDDITNAVSTLRFPDDVETPRVNEFKSNQRAVLDFALYFEGTSMLTDKQRRELQSYTDTLENRINRLPTVSEIDISNYLNDYIEIKIKPNDLILYNISLSEIISTLTKSNLTQPVGTLNDVSSTRIRLDTELDDISLIKNLVIEDTFDGVFYRLKDIAKVDWVMEERGSLYKVNGNEAITLRVTKTSSSGILESTDSIKKAADEFARTILAGTKVKLVVISDNSVDVRNRLSLISSNGLMGFILIVLMLLIILDAKSGFLVAFIIPFTLTSTMIIASITGNTINNMTLAAVIIVLGMVVDNGIVIAENANRLRNQGLSKSDAITRGTNQMIIPITGSIITTCVAFIPLFFFQGRFGILSSFLPPVIFLMLGSSLFAAMFILPSHMKIHIPRWTLAVFSLGIIPLIHKARQGNKEKKQTVSVKAEHWFMKVEEIYGRILIKLLKAKRIIYPVLFALLLAAGFIFMNYMKYEMFPREETTDFHLSGEVDAKMNKYETEVMTGKIEEILYPYLDKEVICYRTNIARSRRGTSVTENTFSIQVELVPREKRKKSSRQLSTEWEQAVRRLEGFKNLRFSMGWWGSSSGSSIDIIVQDNNDSTRNTVAEKINEYLKRMPCLKNPEIEREITRPNYILRLNKDIAYKLNIDANSIAGTLRTVLQGNNVFDLTIDGKDVDVMVSVQSELKKSLESILSIPVQISKGIYVPLKKLVTVTKDSRPDTIQKLSGKRTLHVYADLNDQQKNNGQRENMAREKEEVKEETGDKLDVPVKMTPMEIAEHLEKNLFPQLLNAYPKTEISFGGEIQDTRESSADFIYAIIITVILIYMVLALTLNSLTRSMIILLSIPFGFVGVVFTLVFHGMMVYGFFSVVGILGLAGVVVNNSIVLLNKLDREYNDPKYGEHPVEKVAHITKTRLRAILLTTFTTVAGLFPTAYGVFGYDSMLAEMMLTLAWGLIFGTIITLVLVPAIYCSMKEVSARLKKKSGRTEVLQ
ncbi:MAG: efflux RND transporter permease subunit [Spirochaetales bacterium]|nr:efflux RND transporter permease subunit [Spirochaetales bacterium]